MGACAPKDWLFLAVNEAFFHETGKRTDHSRFIRRIERQIRMIPITQNTEAFELAALDVDEFAGVFLRAAAHFGWRKTGRRFDHAKFDGQTMAIPPRNKRRAKSSHRTRLHHKIFKNLVERGSHVDITIGKRRAIMQQIKRRILTCLLDFLVKAIGFPFSKHLGFPLRKSCLHWKLGLRQVDRVFVSAHEKGE